eukprot:c1374_g1_i1.p1 GENE.c1374_g1_i1~~c1374_g1_i1.p1  ORF type:complete len:257 (-),score=77.26 c1374_g1_i1:38-808(-)
MEDIWIAEQERLKNQLILTTDWDLNSLKYIGGVDISFVKGNDTEAVAAFVVLSYPKLEIVWKDIRWVTLSYPYISGFLAFREEPVLSPLIHHLREQRPELTPQIILVDGNGILHVRGFGLACQLGVVHSIPTIGVAKTFFNVEQLHEHIVKSAANEVLKESGETLELKGDSGMVHGVAMKPTSSSGPFKPIYISQGHRISLPDAVTIVKNCCKYRVPEPIRNADFLSREFVRNTQQQHIPPLSTESHDDDAVDDVK